MGTSSEPGDRMKYWGKMGSFWGGFCLPFGSALCDPILAGGLGAREDAGKLIQGTNAATDVGKVMDAARKLDYAERQLGKSNLN